MLAIMEKEIDLTISRVLFQTDFTDPDLSKDWEAASGQWTVKDGWLEGRHPQNGGGLIYSKASYACDVLLDFEAASIPPCQNDINFSWCTEGWNYAANDAGIGYIAGLGGWWEGKTGVERYPECKVRSLTPALHVVPGQIYHIQAGSINGHCFIFVDGKLIIEVSDPTPIDPAQYGRFALGVYASQVRFRHVKVYEINWRHKEMSYTPNF